MQSLELWSMDCRSLLEAVLDIAKNMSNILSHLLLWQKSGIFFKGIGFPMLPWKGSVKLGRVRTLLWFFSCWAI